MEKGCGGYIGTHVKIVLTGSLLKIKALLISVSDMG